MDARKFEDVKTDIEDELFKAQGILSLMGNTESNGENAREILNSVGLSARAVYGLLDKVQSLLDCLEEPLNSERTPKKEQKTGGAV